ncbi:hypothetical protein P3L10_010341 [Capsicum annuum]
MNILIITFFAFFLFIFLRLGHVKPFLPSESSSRISQMRFLIQGSLGGWRLQRAEKNIKKQEAGLFNPPDDAMENPTVELVKKKLDGLTSIRRVVRQGQPNVEALHDQPQTIIDLGASSRGVTGEVIYDGGSHPDVVAADSRDYEYVSTKKNINTFENTPCMGLSHPYIGLSHPYNGPSHLFSPSCSYCKCKVCKDRENKLFKKLETIAKAAEELKSRRGVIPSNKYIDEIIFLMRGRQLTYPEAYYAADRIIDLNLYNNFKDRYADLRKLDDFGGLGFDKLVSTFQWDEEVIKYVRGKRPYPHSKSWTKAKRILAVVNLEVKYFLTVEILLYEGKVKFYDCNLPVFNEDMFSAHMQPLLKFLPKLVMQSKLMDHLPTEILTKESWDFEGQNKNIELPKNKIGAVCGSYSLTYIECLLTGTEMTDMCDAVVEKI